jgi:two-component system, LytTR family, sensor kinase
MDNQYPVLPLLLGQLVFTAVGAGLVWYLANRRGRTFSEGREQAMFEALQLTNRTLPYLRQGLNRHTAARAVEVIHNYFQPAAVAIVSGQRLLGFVGAAADHHQVGAEYRTELTARALRTGRTMVARTYAEVACDRKTCPLGGAIVAPLRTHRRTLGCLKVYYFDGASVTPGKIRIISALARLMSLQMELAELDRKTEQLAKAELAALQAQISPHFIYNTLNTIASFIRTKPEEARRLLTEFADFTRRSFKQRDEFSPFAQELEYVHQYLSFEQARFGERLSVVYRVDPEILSTVMPVLVLQPLVENAIRHGIGKKPGPGRVIIAAEDRGNECWISVQDDGVGMAPEQVQKVLQGRRDGSLGVGLTSVHERLRTIYGPEYGLQLESVPGEGTRVAFAVPKYRAGVAA